jgi:hypothetical protein
MRPFTETCHCRSGGHCRTCRDLKDGRAWRLSLAAAFALPSGTPDFACPHGRPWGYRPPDRGVGDTVERVLRVTGTGPVAKWLIRALTGKPCGCGRRRERLNHLLPYRKATHRT